MKVKTIWLNKWCNDGLPTPDYFDIKESELNVDEIKNGDIVLEVLTMSVDPYLRMVMKSPDVPGSFLPPEAKATNGVMPMSGFVAGKILASKNSNWKVGDFFGASTEFATFVHLTEEKLKNTVIWNLSGHVDESTISRGVGVLGMPGCTAYAGVIDVLAAKEGETLFVSAASGAVGSLVAQIAKQKNIKLAIGSCGGEKKGKVAKTFGYDKVVDYKEQKTVEQFTKTVKALSVDGIDMYFESVGGDHFHAAFDNLKVGGRVAVCGLISGYNKAQVKTPVNMHEVLGKKIKIEGFMVFDWLLNIRGDNSWLPTLSKWIKEEKLKVEETVVVGIENWGKSLCSYFNGTTHTGKLVVNMK